MASTTLGKILRIELCRLSSTSSPGKSLEEECQWGEPRCLLLPPDLRLQLSHEFLLHFHDSLCWQAALVETPKLLFLRDANPKLTIIILLARQLRCPNGSPDCQTHSSVDRSLVQHGNCPEECPIYARDFILIGSYPVALSFCWAGNFLVAVACELSVGIVVVGLLPHLLCHKAGVNVV